MAVIVDTPDYQIIETVGPNGKTTQLVYKAGSVGANQDAIVAAVANALARLRQIQTQATTFQGQAPYAVANLANLNDLLAKAQLIAGAVNDIATDLIGIARLLSGQFDGTS
jgi:hypothetical protein